MSFSPGIFSTGSEQYDDIGQNEANTTQFEQPVDPDTAEIAFDQDVKMVKAHSPDRNKAGQKADAKNRKPSAAQVTAHAQAKSDQKDDAQTKQSKYESGLHAFAVLVPALGFGQASGKGGECGLQIELFVDGQGGQQKCKHQPEKPFGFAILAERQFCRQKRGKAIGRDRHPTHDRRIANGRRPAFLKTGPKVGAAFHFGRAPGVIGSQAHGYMNHNRCQNRALAACVDSSTYNFPLKTRIEHHG